MNEKKLTKVQKEILTTLRDNPEARIKEEYDHVYRLYIGDKRERTLIWNTWLFLKIWLKIDEKRDRFDRTLYTFKEGAEITDAWRSQEIERQRVEIKRKQEEDERIKEQVEHELKTRVRDAFAAIKRGEIDTIEYGYRVRFEHNGKWYNLVEE